MTRRTTRPRQAQLGGVRPASALVCLASLVIGLPFALACAGTRAPAEDAPAAPVASPYPELLIETDAQGNVYGASETVVPRPARSAGFAAECGERLHSIEEHIEARKLAYAAEALDEIVACFDARMDDPATTYVAFARAGELDRYLRDHPGAEPVVVVDWSYAEAIASQAYTLVARRRFPEALERLYEQMEIAPHAAAPYMEAGFIYYSAYRQPYRALDVYRKGLDLARRFASSSSLEPIALRGIGFSLIEIGRLDEAEGALRESLDLDPGNPMALSELEYIDHLRSQGPYAR